MIMRISIKNIHFCPFLTILIFTSFLAAGCFKGNDQEPISRQEQLEIDIQAIDAYLQANQIDASSHESGLRYMVRTEGNDTIATINDSITVNYEGIFMQTGLPFDSGQNVTLLLGDLIQGWQIGLRLIGEGGSIVLFIPSEYCYGPFGVAGVIPANAILIFDIDLLDVQSF
jgi:FKBP-type peptidyl-prolyl cis-trans isomerase FkpA